MIFICVAGQYISKNFKSMEKHSLELDELLAKGTFEPLTGGAGIYSTLFVVPKHTGTFITNIISKAI